MYNIRSNCDNALWIENGKIMQAGNVNDVCDAYEVFSAREHDAEDKMYSDDSFEVIDVNYPDTIDEGSDFFFEFTVKSEREIENVVINISIFTMANINVISNFSSFDGFSPSLEIGSTKFRIKYNNIPLKRGTYNVNFFIADTNINNQLAAFVNCFRLEVKPSSTSLIGGLIRLEGNWLSERV